jgi:hypothetical protein
VAAIERWPQVPAFGFGSRGGETFGEELEMRIASIVKIVGWTVPRAFDAFSESVGNSVHEIFG